jgi:hypothetical protein
MSAAHSPDPGEIDLAAETHNDKERKVGHMLAGDYTAVGSSSPASTSRHSSR